MGLLAAGALLILQASTAPRIRVAEQQARERQVRQVLLVDDAAPIQSQMADLSVLNQRGDERIHFIQTQDSRVFALPVRARDGYSGDIELLVGYAPDGTVLSFQVLKQAETPGLGDAILPSKSRWSEQLLGAAANRRFEVTQRGGAFQSLSAATITSSAVLRAVGRGSAWVQSNSTELAKRSE
jgi:Na+-translocating ferredoxin:NAD+ oxidoreductase subunit G